MFTFTRLVRFKEIEDRKNRFVCNLVCITASLPPGFFFFFFGGVGLLVKHNF